MSHESQLTSVPSHHSAVPAASPLVAMGEAHGAVPAGRGPRHTDVGVALVGVWAPDPGPIRGAIARGRNEEREGEHHGSEDGHGSAIVSPVPVPAPFACGRRCVCGNRLSTWNHSHQCFACQHAVAHAPDQEDPAKAVKRVAEAKRKALRREARDAGR